MLYTPFRSVALVSALFTVAFAARLVHAAPPAPVLGQPSPSPLAPVHLTPSSGERVVARGQLLARAALTYRGMKYRFGGSSSRSGFDCSGLVQAVCAKYGIYLPRAARAQYSEGKAVALKNLAAGDLVFFKNTYKHGLSHVGIYIGDGLFLHAASRRKGVMVSSLNEDYHRNHWAGARRLNLSHLPAVPAEEQEIQRILFSDTPLVAPTSN